MRNGLTPVKEKDTVHSMENHRGMSEAISISIQMTQVLYKLIQIERRQFNDKWDSDFGPTHLSTLPLRQACGMGEMVQTLNINYSFRLHGVKSCACQWWDQMKINFFDIFHNFHLWLLMIVNICDIWFHILHNISCD